MPALPMQDKKIVTTALAALPPRINAAKEKEMGDMMGKLKEVGCYVFHRSVSRHADVL